MHVVSTMWGQVLTLSSKYGLTPDTWIEQSQVLLAESLSILHVVVDLLQTPINLPFYIV